MPGSTLLEYFPFHEEGSIKIISEIISKLHLTNIPDCHNFCHVNDLLQILDNDIAIPNDILLKAKKIKVANI